MKKNEFFAQEQPLLGNGFSRFNAIISALRYLSVILASLLPSTSAWACASCGSGSDDPLVLFPNHAWRFYLGLARATGFQTVRPDGTLGEEAAAQFKDSATFAVGRALRSDAFVTFTLPYLQNWRAGEYKRSVGDPTVAARWSVVEQDIANEWIPQVQVMFAHRFATATSQHEAENPFRLDAFGTGIEETKWGIDVFHGMSTWKVGLASAFLFPGERNLGGNTHAPGFGVRTTFSGGYGISGTGKLMAGWVRETRSAKKVDGIVQQGSNVEENNVYLMTDYELSSSDVLRLSVTRRSAFLTNKNGSRSDAFAMAWQKSVGP